MLALVVCLLQSVISGIWIVGFVLAGPLALVRKAPTEVGHLFKGIPYHTAARANFYRVLKGEPLE